MARFRLAKLFGGCLAMLALSLPTYANFIARDTQPNPYVSNGSCYYTRDNQADSAYIPCGNTAFGVFSCCAAGSICLSNNACYLKPNTYVAGCTDSSYLDPSCPHKGPYAAQQWSGMVYCADGSQKWTLCDDASSGSNVPVSVSGCVCPADQSSRFVAFTAQSVLLGSLILPTSGGGTMTYYSGYGPSTVLTSKLPSTSASTSSSKASSNPATNGLAVTSDPNSSQASAAATSTSSVAAPTPRHSSLSTGEMAGIGIGAALGGLLIIAVITGMAFYIRKLRKRQLEHEYNPYQPPSEPLMVVMDHSRDPARPGHGWSDNTSGLASNEFRGVSSTMSPESTLRTSRPMSTELEGSIPKHSSMASLQTQDLSSIPVHGPSEQMNEVPVGVHRVPGSANMSQGSYRPGRQIGDGVYEMPAYVPGSTFLGR